MWGQVTPRLLESDEIARLIDEMPDHLTALVACAVYAGLRREELFHLRWEDVKGGELNVVSRQDHPTKNRETRRIPISETLKEALDRHPHRLGCPYVFTNLRGQMYNDVRKPLSAAALRAGIEDNVNLHQLRHAFCSHALMSGIDARTVQRWMGHKNLPTTMRYSHTSPDHERAAIQRLRYESRHQVGTDTDGH